MSPKQISEVLFSIFSEEGYNLGGLKLRCESPVTANVNSGGDRTSITFGNNYPRAEIKKLITLYVYIEEIVFGKEGGSIKLRNFPDINFGYDTDTLIGLLAKNIPSIKFGDEENKLEDEAIAAKFPDSEPKQKIAKICLQYGREY